MPAKFKIVLKLSLFLLTFLFLGALLTEKTYAQETTILRPSGPGDFSQWTASGCASNWQCVDEVNSDSEVTYVESTADSQADFYDLPASSIPAGSTIDSVTVWVMARADVWTELQIGVRTNNANNYSIRKYPWNWYNPSKYQPFSNRWTVNPTTSSPWTLSEINNLQIGVRAYSAPQKVTQIWSIVKYTPPGYVPPDPAPAPNPPINVEYSSAFGLFAPDGAWVGSNSLGVRIRDDGPADSYPNTYHWHRFYLYLDDGDDVFDPAADALILEETVGGAGITNFNADAYPPGGETSTTFFNLGGYPDGQRFFWRLRNNNCCSWSSNPPPESISTWSPTYTFVIDNERPTSTINDPACPSTSSLTSFSGTASDAYSGVWGTAISLQRDSDGLWWDWGANSWGASQEWEYASGTTSWTIDSSSVTWTNGENYTVFSRAEDNAIYSWNTESPANSLNVTVGTCDLEVTSINITPNPATSGDSVTADVRVTNNGTADIGTPFEVSFCYDWDSTSGCDPPSISPPQSVTNLASGASAVLSFTFTAPSVSSSTSFTAWAKVDSGDIIPESDETNNENTASYLVEPSGPPPWIKTTGGDVGAKGKINSSEIVSLGPWEVQNPTPGKFIAGDTSGIDGAGGYIYGYYSDSAMIEYQGNLYFGTRLNGKGEIYKYDGSTFTKVSQPMAGQIAPGGTMFIYAVSSMTIYNDKLYVGTRKLNGTEIYRYNGGTDWERVSYNSGEIISGGTNGIHEITSMTVYNSKLYVGTWKATAAEVYSYDDITDTWTLVSVAPGQIAPGGVTEVESIGSMTVYNNKLYVGAYKPDSAEIYSYDGAGTWVIVAGPGQIVATGDPDVDGIVYMISYDGLLYAGSYERDSAEVYRYDGGTWTLASPGGGQIGSMPTVGGITSMTIHYDTLYIGTYEYFGRAEVYRYEGGTSWTLISEAPGQIIPGGTTSIDTVSAMTVYNGSLYIGTNELNSAEVYKYKTTYPINAEYLVVANAAVANFKSAKKWVIQDYSGGIDTSFISGAEFSELWEEFGNSRATDWPQSSNGDIPSTLGIYAYPSKDAINSGSPGPPDEVDFTWDGTGTAAVDDPIVLFINGNLNINRDLNLGNKKVVFIVKGNINAKGSGPCTRIVNAQVGIWQDDGEVVNDTSFSNSGSLLRIGNYSSNVHDSFYRFTGFNIPQNSTIQEAYVSLQVSTPGVSFKTRIFADKSASPLSPTSAVDFANRIRTTAYVDWDAPLGSNSQYFDSPPITSVVQELVGSSNLTSILILHEDNNSPTGHNLPFSQQSPRIHIKYTTPSVGLCTNAITFNLGGSMDDVYEQSGSVTNANPIYLNANGNLAGFRFPYTSGIGGSTITKAELKFYVPFNSFSSISEEIYAEKAESPLPFELTNNNISNRPLTTANETWFGSNAGWHTSPDFSPVIQEIIDSYDPTAVAIILKHITTTGARLQITELTASLTIEYTIPTKASNIDGLFLNQGAFNSESCLSDDTSCQLIINGGAIAFGGFILGRDLGTSNPTNPAEIFNYDPAYLYLFAKIDPGLGYSFLGEQKGKYTELPP